MRRPDTAVLVVFLLVALIGGSNFVAVRFSNRELPPFWGAGFRFALAALLLLAFALWRRIPLPIGAQLPGVAAYGLVNFGIFYAFAYWALLEVPAAVASTIAALTPLATFLLAVMVGMERFNWASLAGGLVAVAGVAVVFADQLSLNVPLGSLVAMLFALASVAVAGVQLKGLPRTHPIATNAIAMVPGAAMLLLISLVAGEAWTLPSRPDTVAAVAYLVTFGTIGLFAGVVYVMSRWTASATAYVSVLFPVVTVALGAILAAETVSAQFFLGTALAMAGTYLGVFVRAAPTPPRPSR